MLGRCSSWDSTLTGHVHYHVQPCPKSTQPFFWGDEFLAPCCRPFERKRLPDCVHCSSNTSYQMSLTFAADLRLPLSLLIEVLISEPTRTTSRLYSTIITSRVILQARCSVHLVPSMNIFFLPYLSAIFFI